MPEKKTVFMEGGEFYKGNLHCHSVVSDGSLTIRELKEIYVRKGYQFMVFSDHNVYGNYVEMNSPGFIAVQGFEGHIDMSGADDFREFHFIMLPGPKALRESAGKPFFNHLDKTPVTRFKGNRSIQKYINDMNGRGYMVMACHPHWSTAEYDDILGLENLFAVEIYNHACHLVNMCGALVLWDALLRRGKRIWGTAVDDNHNQFPVHSQYFDSCGGWVSVKAKSLKEEDICESLANGSFYSSQGPEIRDFYVEDGHAYLSCSPVNKIYFVGDSRGNYSDMAPEGEDSLTFSCKKLKGKTKYIRAECVDAAGKRAVSNPIFFE